MPTKISPSVKVSFSNVVVWSTNPKPFVGGRQLSLAHTRAERSLSVSKIMMQTGQGLARSAYYSGAQELRHRIVRH